jgi:PAS domain-containing protein
MGFHVTIRRWVTLLFLLMMLIGLGAVVGFARLETGIDSILLVEYRGLLAGQHFLRALEARHQGVAANLRGPGAAPPAAGTSLGDTAVEAARAVRRTFELLNVFPAGGEYAHRWERVRRATLRYAEELESLCGAEGTDVRDPFERRVQPAYETLRRELDEWILSCERGMERARDTALRGARTLSVGMVGATFLGMLALLFFNHRVEEAVIRPATGISALLNRVHAGESTLRLPEQHEDYLNRVAAACNRLLDTLALLSEESRRRVETERHTAVALIEAIPDPAVVVDLAGELLLANGAARDLFMEADGAQHLQAFREAVRQERPQVRLGDTTYGLREITGSESAHTVPVAVVILSRAQPAVPADSA